MKRMLSFKNLLLVALAAFSFSTVKAQTTIQTVYTNTNALTIAAPDGNIFSAITFHITNDNCYPITVSDISYYHMARITANTGSGTIDISNNGSIYTLLYTPTVNFGFPNLNTWNIVASGNPVTAANNGIIPVITGMNFVIPGNTTYRCAMYLNDSMAFAGARSQPTAFPPTPHIYPEPPSFTQKNVTLTTLAAPFTGLSYALTAAGTVTGPLPEGIDGYAFLGAITFRPAGPTIAAQNNNACIGDSITLVANLPSCIVPGTATINWFGPAGIHTGNTWKIEATQANAGQYFASYTDTGVSATTAITVNVTPTPPPPTVTGKTQYCVNEQFEALTATGTNILWYTVPTGGTGTTLPPYVNTSQPGAYTWYATQTTDVTFCESDLRTPVTITVAPKPKPPVVVSPIGFCELVPADSLTAEGENLKWYYAASGGLGSVFAPTPNTSVKGTYTWFVSQTVDGCESQRSRIDAVVTFRPNGMIVPSRTSICAGDTISFWYYGSADATTTYNWDVSTAGATLLQGTTGPGPLVVQFDSAGIRPVSLFATNLGCRSETYFQDVKIKPIPVAEIAAPQNVCPDAITTVSLAYFTPTVDSFYWSWDGGIEAHGSSDQGPYGIKWEKAGDKVISLTMVEEGCSGTTSDTIRVVESPDSRIMGYNRGEGGQGELICQGDTLFLQPGTIVANSQYLWTPETVFKEYNTDPLVNVKVSFDDVLKLEVTDAFGCKSSDSIRVRTEACCDVVFPSAFTPNGDGKNDFFKPVYIGKTNSSSFNSGGDAVSSFRVMNRWGQVVFEAANAAKGWDGTISGEPLDMGVYYYYITYDCNGKKKEQKGEVTLIK